MCIARCLLWLARDLSIGSHDLGGWVDGMPGYEVLRISPFEVLDIKC